MITKEKLIEILKNNSQKSVIGWAVEENDFDSVADEIIKISSVPDVVVQNEQLEDFVKYLQDKYGVLLDQYTETIVENYKSSN